jgi:hypothetical protein
MVFMAECEACPLEYFSPKDSPGPVLDEETIIRLGVIPSHVAINSHGGFHLVPAAVSKSELQGKDDHSYSLLREDHLEKGDLIVRAKGKSTFPGWKNNPVLARTSVGRVRAVVDNNGRREVCVNADPTTDEIDQFGACPAHASALRSENPPRSKSDPNRIGWMLLRAWVGACFTDIRHLDGAPVTLSELDGNLTPL